MAAISEVEVGELEPQRFRELLGRRYGELEAAIARGRELFDGRVVWHVNSTARGGGVAELLQSLLAYTRGAGIDARWMVIGGEPDFFAITKRIHNHLHGAAGDGEPLGPEQHGVYERALAAPGRELAARVSPHDVVFLHDPQTAGMVEAIAASGALVVWRCHVGLDEPNATARGAWRFLVPYVDGADAFVFSRHAFAWDSLDRDRIWLVAPSIDAFAPKNSELPPDRVEAILLRAGIGSGEPRSAPEYARIDGSTGTVERRAELTEDGPLPAGALLVTQVSRWDRLKDPVGVLHGFAAGLGDRDDAHLLLAGPAVEAVSDDPEGAEVLAEVRAARERLEPEVRARTHLACLPMDDVQENAAIVNAIQRRSDIVVQKSLAEGFGLTVAEAMWKSAAVIASGIGGIQDQIVDGESGILLADPADLEGFAAALRRLAADPGLRARLGAAAHARVESEFLGSRHLLQYLDLLSGPLAERLR